MHTSRERSAKVSSIGSRVLPSIHPYRGYKAKDQTQSLYSVFQHAQTALVQHATLFEIQFFDKRLLLPFACPRLYDLESGAHRLIPAALQPSPEMGNDNALQSTASGTIQLGGIEWEEVL